MKQAAIVGDISKNNISSHVPGLQNMAFSNKNDENMKYQLLENQSWRPALAITGASGLPDPTVAGNVLRAKTSLKISVRLPPTLKCEKLVPEIEKILTTDVPYNANVTLSDYDTGDGFQTPIIP